LIGDITSSSFPPTCVVSNYRPAAACRIYGDRRLVVFVSELRIDDSAAKIAHRLNIVNFNAYFYFYFYFIFIFLNNKLVL